MPRALDLALSMATLAVWPALAPIWKLRDASWTVTLPWLLVTVAKAEEAARPAATLRPLIAPLMPVSTLPEPVARTPPIEPAMSTPESVRAVVPKPEEVAALATLDCTVILALAP